MWTTFGTQDGATSHAANEKINLLKETFGEGITSRSGLPRLCDLTPLAYILWGCVKSLAYADKLELFNAVEENI